MVQFHAIPRMGSTATDDLAWADERDVLIAITCKPYRREVIEAIQIARDQGVKVIGISDSPASPVIAGSCHGFVVAADTPQFFSFFSVDHSFCWKPCSALSYRLPVLKLSIGWTHSTAAATNWASIWRAADEPTPYPRAGCAFITLTPNCLKLKAGACSAGPGNSPATPASWQKIGDYVTFALNGENLFCIRDRSGDIKAYYNVCQHRAHELLRDAGNTKAHRLPLSRLDV